MQLKFENITISGGVAVGKNTLKDNLRTYLEPLGWKFTSGGQILRDFTKEYVQPLASLADEDFHRKLDQRTLDLLTKEKNYVIEAWLSGFVARDLDNTLRVLLVCENDALRIDRVANRDKVSIQQAKDFIHQRERDNFREWKRIYGDHDFWGRDIYHLVIDTYSSSQEETVARVLERLGFPR